MIGSKWLQIPVLCEIEEIRDLFSALGDFMIYNISQCVRSGEEEILKENFLNIYDGYISQLRVGKIPEESQYRHAFSSAFTVSSQAVSVVKNRDDSIVRLQKPVVQLQNHRMLYSKEENKMRSMVYGCETILWGIQFSFPQLFQDSNTQKIEKTNPFPNRKLFQRLQKWVRQKTTPTTFVINGQKTTYPVRLGKQCSWINKHPQLVEKKIEVFTNTRI